MKTNFIVGLSITLNLISIIYVINYSVIHFKPIAVVDMGQVIKMTSERLAKKYGQVPPLVMNKTVQAIKAQLEEFAKEHQLNLLAKSSWLGGEVKDYTTAILQLLRDNNYEQ